MFTTGSKLFLGATTLSLFATAGYAVTKGGDTGWTATVGLITLSLVLVFLTALNFYVRDNNVSAADPDAVTTAAAAQVPPERSMWPAVAGLGAALVVVGLVTEPIVFKAGLVVLFAVLLEWSVQAWAERASSDPVYNSALRKRLMHPLEFPVLGALGLGIVIYSFSRIMLFLSKSSGPAAFAVIAALVLLIGFLFASKQTLRRSITVGVCSIAALGLVSTGAVTAIDGERAIHEHETVGEDPSICLSNEHTEADERGSQNLALKNGMAAIVRFDGQTLVADPAGPIDETLTMTLPRSVTSAVVFENHSDADVRMTAHLGKFTEDVNGTPVTESPVACTTLVEPGGTQLLTLTFDKSSRATTEDSPYRLAVPDFEQPIMIVVP